MDLRENIDEIKKMLGIFGDDAEDICSKNHKPASVFDDRYKTMLSFVYEYPLNMNADDVWRIACSCAEKNTDCDKLKELTDNLQYRHFPYHDVEKLDFETKVDILRGMASEFNYDDIVWWAIEKKDQEYYDKIVKDIKTNIPKEMAGYITWHPSPNTYAKIKNLIPK